MKCKFCLFSLLLIKQIHHFLVNPVKQKHSLSQAILVPLPYYMQMLFSQRQVSSNIAFMAARNYVQQDQVTALNLILAIFTFIMPVLLNFL